MYTRKGKIHTLLHSLTKWIDKDRKMIILRNKRVLENYFIDKYGVITNKSGEVQLLRKFKLGYLHFKGTPVHKIQMWTNYGYEEGVDFAIHHIDRNKLNNSLENLIFLTHKQHRRIHRNDFIINKKCK